MNGHWPNSDMLVLPMITAPAARSRAVATPSSATGVDCEEPPYIVAWPATSFSSLIATGTPWSGPRAISAAPSRASASASASSAMTTRNALRRGSSRAIRPSRDSVSSREESSPARISSACLAMPAKARSVASIACKLRGLAPL